MKVATWWAQGNGAANYRLIQVIKRASERVKYERFEYIECMS